MSDRRLLNRVTNPPALDRSPQLLPVPLGGLIPARRRPSRLLRSWRRHQPQVVMFAALVAGVCGAWLAASPQPSTVVVSAAGVDIDSVLLTPVASQAALGLHVFGGPASLAVSVPQGGTSRAGAVMTWGGIATIGQCVLAVVGSRASEACQFREGPSRFSAADTFDARGHVWHRRYADGSQVTIMVPAGSPLIPIPFPLGH
jgi:hypothetical protein